jgi:hypothetical protein
MKPQSNIKIENDNQIQVYEEVTQIPKFSSTQVTSQALVGYSPGQRVSEIITRTINYLIFCVA